MLNQQQRLRRIVWMGSSFDDLRQFPEDVRRDAGFQLYRLQSGLGLESDASTGAGR